MTARPSGQPGITLGPICTPWNSGEDSTCKPELTHNTHTHTRADTRATNSTQTHRNTCMPHAGCHSYISQANIKHRHTHTDTHTHTHTQHRHEYKHAYKHDFVWLNTHASTSASTDGWGRERDGGSLMSYEGSRGQRESSVLAAAQPLKCHPDKAGNQLEHGASTTRAHTRTNTTAALREDADCNHWSVA